VNFLPGLASNCNSPDDLLQEIHLPKLTPEERTWQTSNNGRNWESHQKAVVPHGTRLTSFMKKKDLKQHDGFRSS
jgi:hypothetical protein